MYRRATRSLFAATTALLLCATACDKAEDKKADDKNTDDKAEVKAPEPEPQPEPPQPEPPQPEVNAEAGADAGAEAGAEAGADAGAEAGEPTPAAEEGGEAGEDKPAEDKPDEDDKKPAEKKPAETASKIDGKPIFDAKCKSCHGADGKGDTTIGKKVNISSLAGTKLSKAKIVSTIEDGVPDTKMKAYKDKLSKDEIDAVAAYVKKL